MEYKILIIDDEPSNIDVMISTLLKEKFNILIASNGSEGYRVAVQNRPSFILMN